MRHSHRLQVRALFRRAGGRENFRAGVLSQLHGGESDAACRGVDEHALSAGKFCKMVERIVGREERNRNRGRLSEAESGRLGDDGARVRGGEGAEAGVRHGDHFVAGLHVRYIRPDGGNRSRAFGAEGDRPAGIYARGIHHIAKIQARGIYADFDFAGLRLRTRGSSQHQILEISGARDIQAKRIRYLEHPEARRSKSLGARGTSRATYRVPFRKATSRSVPGSDNSSNSAASSSGPPSGSRSIRVQPSSACSRSIDFASPHKGVWASETRAGVGPTACAPRVTIHRRRFEPLASRRRD